jgi:YVTN family beta-propeller protein
MIPIYIANSGESSLSINDAVFGGDTSSSVKLKGQPSFITRGKWMLWISFPDSDQIVTLYGEGAKQLPKKVAVGRKPVYILGGDYWRRWKGSLGGYRFKKICVSNQGDNTVSVIDEDSLKVVSTIPVGNAPEGLALSPDDSLLAVVNAGSDNVMLIQTTTLKVIGTYKVGKTPRRAAFAVYEPHLFVSLFGEDSVAVLNYRTGVLVKKIPVGRNPVDVLVTPGGHVLYVANQGTEDKPDNRVTRIKLPDLKLVRHFVCGQGCFGLARQIDGPSLVVTNTFDNTSTIIYNDGQTRTFKVGKRPTGVSF